MKLQIIAQNAWFDIEETYKLLGLSSKMNLMEESILLPFLRETRIKLPLMVIQIIMVISQSHHWMCAVRHLFHDSDLANVHIDRCTYVILWAHHKNT